MDRKINIMKMKQIITAVFLLFATYAYSQNPVYADDLYADEINPLDASSVKVNSDLYLNGAIADSIAATRGWVDANTSNVDLSGYVSTTGTTASGQVAYFSGSDSTVTSESDFAWNGSTLTVAGSGTTNSITSTNSGSGNAIEATNSGSGNALKADNIAIDGNDITSTNTDGEINIEPNGDGRVNINSRLVVDSEYTIDASGIYSSTNNAIFAALGTGYNASIVAVDGRVSIDPRGTGTIQIGGINVDQDISLVSYSAGANANIVLVPKGSGQVYLGSTSSTDSIVTSRGWVRANISVIENLKDTLDGVKNSATGTGTFEWDGLKINSFSAVSKQISVPEEFTVTLTTPNRQFGMSDAQGFYIDTDKYVTIQSDSVTINSYLTVEDSASLGKLINTNIRGGSIDNTPIGATTASTIAGTTITINNVSPSLTLNSSETDWNLGYNASSNIFRIRDATAGNNVFTIENGAPQNSLDIEADGNVNLSYSLSATGNILPSGTPTIGVTGTRWTNAYFTNITSTNAVTVDSDSTLKSNITPILSSIDIIKSINPVSYTWKPRVIGSHLVDSVSTPIYNDTTSVHYGVIAQELQEVLPDLVKNTGDNLSVAYTELIPFLIKAIQEQQAKIEELETRIEALEDN
jgi:hypothetical protein